MNDLQGCHTTIASTTPISFGVFRFKIGMVLFLGTKENLTASEMFSGGANVLSLVHSKIWMPSPPLYNTFKISRAQKGLHSIANKNGMKLVRVPKT